MISPLLLKQITNPINKIVKVKKPIKIKHKTKSDLINELLYIELFTELKKIDPKACQEVVFSSFMNTKRKFRADFLCPTLKIIWEINGGQYLNGRHNRGGVGYENDLTKLNMAQVNGYKILQFTYQMLSRGEHLEFIHSYTK